MERGMAFRVHHGGHTFWTIERVPHEHFSIMMADAHPGTFGWSLVVRLVAKHRVTLSPPRVNTMLKIRYNPLIPSGMKFAHMVFGGFSVHYESPTSVNESMVRSNNVYCQSLQFYHMGRLGLATDADEYVAERATAERRSPSSRDEVGTNQFAQRVDVDKEGYVQWVSPYFREMEMRMRFANDQTLERGDVAATIHFGNFGQPGFVMARRFGTIQQTFNSVPNVVVGYKVAGSTFEERARLHREFAQTPSMDKDRLHSQNDGHDVFIASTVVSTTASSPLFDFWGLFYYHVLDCGRPIQLFRVAFANMTGNALQGDTYSAFSLVHPSQGPMTSYTDTVPSDRMSDPSWKAGLWFEPAWRRTTGLQLGTDASTNPSSFSVYPHLGNETSIGQLTTNNRIDPPNMPQNTLNLFTGGNSSHYAVTLIGARTGDMWGACVYTKYNYMLPPPAISFRIQVLPYGGSGWTGGSVLLRPIASSTQTVSIQPIFGSTYQSAHLTIDSLASFSYPRNCINYMYSRVVRFPSWTGSADWPGSQACVADILDQGNLEKTAFRFIARLDFYDKATRTPDACFQSKNERLSSVSKLCIGHEMYMFGPEGRLKDWITRDPSMFSPSTSDRCPVAVPDADPTCSCPQGQIIVGHICAAPCPPNFEQDQETGACSCPQDRFDLWQGQCIPKCFHLDERAPTGECANPCPRGLRRYFSLVCEPPCTPHSTKTPTGCVCDAGREMTGGVCLPVCRDGEERPGPGMECRCKPGFQRVQESCRAPCADGQILNLQTGACECRRGTVMVGTSCLTPCPPDRPLRGADGQCIGSCPVGTVRDPSSALCVCEAGKEAWNAICVAACAPGQVRNVESGLCRDPPPPEPQQQHCAFGVGADGACLQCDASTHEVVQKQCVPKCTGSQRRNDATGLCEQLPPKPTPTPTPTPTPPTPTPPTPPTPTPPTPPTPPPTQTPPTQTPQWVWFATGAAVLLLLCGIAGAVWWKSSKKKSIVTSSVVK
jgi:hypothetical protein